MKALILIVLAFTLSGCATIGTIATAGQRICDSKETIGTALNLALTQAFTISDPTRRDLTERGLRLSLTALDICPDSN